VVAIGPVTTSRINGVLEGLEIQMFKNISLFSKYVPFEVSYSYPNVLKWSFFNIFFNCFFRGFLRPLLQILSSGIFFALKFSFARILFRFRLSFASLLFLSMICDQKWLYDQDWRTLEEKKIKFGVSKRMKDSLCQRLCIQQRSRQS